MKQEYKAIPKPLSSRTEYPDGANSPTEVIVYRCFCKKGTIEYCYVPGFNDDWFDIKCKACDKKYAYIARCGSEWIVDLA